MDSCFCFFSSIIFCRRASFSFSFLFSAYWLLLWMQFKISTRSPRVEPPAPALVSQPHAQVWRRLGAFVALVCAGQLVRECMKNALRQEFEKVSLCFSNLLLPIHSAPIVVLTLFVAGSACGIVAWSFNIRS